MKCTDFLILQFEPFGRDPEAIFPLAWYLEHVFHYKVQFGSMMDARYLIDMNKPKVLLLNNIVGNEFNIIAAKYAYNCGVKVISLISEGLYFEYEKNPKELFWGDLKEHAVCWHKMFFWSDHFLQKMSLYHRKLKKTFDVSGSTAIDRLLMYSHKTRYDVLKKYRKNEYKKVVTYFGYNFSVFFKKELYHNYNISDSLASLFCNDYLQTKDLLYKVIQKNKDILFILKKHPTELSIHREIDYSWSEENIIFLEDQEAIGDLIGISDIIFVYDSTVSYEAYALHKPVVNFVPNKRIQYKNDSYLGNVHVDSVQSAQKIIDEFYRTGNIKQFNNLEKIRQSIIRRDLYAADGLNSWRTAKKINIFLNSVVYTRKSSFSLYGYLLHIFLVYNQLLFWIPKFNKSFILRYYNKFDTIYKLKNRYDPQIKRYYKKYIEIN